MLFSLSSKTRVLKLGKLLKSTDLSKLIAIGSTIANFSTFTNGSAIFSMFFRP